MNNMCQVVIRDGNNMKYVTLNLYRGGTFRAGRGANSRVPHCYSEAPHSGSVSLQLLVHFPLLVLLLAPAPTANGQAILTQAEQKLCADEPLPLDCDDIYDQGSETDGVYLIYPAGPNTPVPVYCDMTTDDGKWTVFQKRFNGSVSFFRGWNDYRFGFGRADGEYWLGRVFQKRFNGSVSFFRGWNDYRFGFGRADGEYWLGRGPLPRWDGAPPSNPPPSDPGDSLSYHTGQKFSTFDRDQDLYVQNCAALSSGAWWFKSCHFSNLNGFYLGGAHLSYANGLNWAQWKGFYYSLRKSEMKIRRI
nr:microfibril-associated glycoprotein 4 [Pelodiscus sinensis]|eukprot:XP_025046101.1 microfibril-associated glycoprotein 4 [Pelodiscus sinensis]